MTRPLTRCQFVAFGAGVLLCGVGFAVLYGQATLFHRLAEARPLISLTLGLGLDIAIPAAFAFMVARYARNYEGVAFITTLLPALLLLVALFVTEEDMRISSAARHSMNVGLTADWLLPGIFLLLWWRATALIGIGLKRRFNGEALLGKAEPAARERGVYAFRLFLLVLAVAAVVGLGFHFAATWEKNSPAGRVATASEVLESSTSTMGQRAKVLFDIHRLMKEQSAVEVLRKAMREQPEPLNVLAAAELAMHNDVSALPLLEANLMKSGEWDHSWKDFSGKANLGSDLRLFTDPTAAPALGRLLNSEDDQVRRGAAQSLRNMHDDVAIEAMLGGLENADWEVRWVSVMGLAEVVGKQNGEKESWFPAHDNFRDNEQKYLDHWKQWGARWRASR